MNSWRQKQIRQSRRCRQQRPQYTQPLAELNDIWERESFNECISLQQHLENVEDSYKNFRNLKNFRFEFQCQGASIASAKPEIMLAYGGVIQALWADFPDFGQLILAHFHKECPYVVPIIKPKAEGQSNEDYYTSLGYRYDDSGEMEKDACLRRMSGTMQLSMYPSPWTVTGWALDVMHAQYGSTN
jgi:hypothetical protein